MDFYLLQFLFIEVSFSDGGTSSGTSKSLDVKKKKKKEIGNNSKLFVTHNSSDINI